MEDGAVVVAGGRIVAVGSSAEIAPCWRARK
ncbi:imidazolonepropionase-like domain-containing protein, partial [Verminephrobacter aporrectodeae]